MKTGIGVFLISAMFIFGGAATEAQAFSMSGFSAGSGSGGNSYSVISAGSSGSKSVSNWQKTAAALTEMGYKVDGNTLSNIIGKSALQSAVTSQATAALVLESAGKVTASQMPVSMQNWMAYGNPQGTYNPYSNQYYNYPNYYSYSYGGQGYGWFGQSNMGYNMYGNSYGYTMDPYSMGPNVNMYGTGWGYQSYGSVTPMGYNPGYLPYGGGPQPGDLDY